MKDKINYYKILKLSLIPVNLLLVLTFLLNYLNLLPVFWKSIYVFYFVLIINTAFLTLKIKQIHENKIESNIIVYLSKYFFLLSLIILALNQFLKREVVINNLFYIFGISIALGFLTFYSSRNKVETELELEKIDEGKIEAARKKNFESKFTNLNRVPIVGNIIKFMYKEGWYYSIGLIFIILIGLILRVWNIWNIPFQADEIYHALTIRSGNLVPTLDSRLDLYSLYPRGLIVHYLGMLGNILFIKPEIGLRVFGIICGLAIAVLSYYFLKKYYSKKVGILCSFLFSFDLWLLEFSRYARFYIYTLFFMLVISFILYKSPSLKPRWIKSKFIGLIVFGTISPYIFNEYLFFFYLILFCSFLMIKIKGLSFRTILKIKAFPLLIGGILYVISNYIINSRFFPKVTSNFNSYSLVQIKFLINNYIIFLIIFLSLFIYLLLSKIIFKYSFLSFLNWLGLGTIISFVIINYLSYNETVRVLLFLLIWLVVIFSIGISFIKHEIKYAIILLVIIFSVAQLINIPYKIGDMYSNEKIVYEKQPLLLDYLPSKEVINQIEGNYLAAVCVNGLFTRYYFDKKPDYVARWNSPSYITINERLYERTNLVLAITKPEEINEIIRGLDKPIIFDICGTAYPINNQFYLEYLNKPYALEVPPELIKEIENATCKKVFMKRDGYSRDILVCPEDQCQLCD